MRTGVEGAHRLLVAGRSQGGPEACGYILGCLHCTGFLGVIIGFNASLK